MQKNMGTIDRAIRIVIGVILFVLHFTYDFSNTLDMFLLIIATFIFVTCLISFCPFYYLFGLSTRKDEE